MPERRPEDGPEDGLGRGPKEGPGSGRERPLERTRIPRAVLGRRTTLAVACVLAVLGGPAASAAVASPVPQPSPGVSPSAEPGPAATPAADGMDRWRNGGQGHDRGSGAGDDHWAPALPEPAGGADDAAVDTSSPGGPPAGDGEQTLEDVRKRLDDLHDRAESATEAYNAAGTKAAAQRERIAGLERRAADTRKRLGELKKRAGALARAQYRSGGLPAAARLMLSDDPEEFLRDAGLARRGQQAAKGLVASLTDTRDRLDRYTRDAKKRYTELQQNRAQKAAAKKRIEKQLKKAEKLESRLAADERARLRELERRAAYARQLRWLRTGVLAEIDSMASAQGKKAVEYATAQIGKDYEWGAEGPATYDCSGLTMRAWEAAGVSIPRTSQEQWRALPRVDIEDMRPGDLIIYKEDAGHVGMYLGDGVMVHAPRTGRQITVEGAGSYPILGVVRPDK